MLLAPRQIKWKTTTIDDPHLGRVRVTHWAKHDPQQILTAIKSGPVLHPREGEQEPVPPLSVHAMPVRQFQHHLAVRRIPLGKLTDGQERELSSGTYFNFLRRTIAAKRADLELPVAFVRRLEPTPKSPKGDYVVTLWKKDMTRFADYARSNVSAKEKLETFAQVMREIAKTHATGFIHGHLGPTDETYESNIVVNKRNRPKLIDWTWLDKIDRKNPENDRNTEAELTANKLASTYMETTKESERKTINRFKIIKQLMDAYRNEYKKR